MHLLPVPGFGRPTGEVLGNVSSSANVSQFYLCILSYLRLYPVVCCNWGLYGRTGSPGGSVCLPMCLLYHPYVSNVGETASIKQLDLSQ